MPGHPFDRTAIYARERPLGSDINQAQSQLDYSLREVLRRLLAPRTSATNYGAAEPSGFIGTGFQVKAQSPAAMQVVVSAGVGFITAVGDTPASIGETGGFVNAIGIDDLSTLKPLVLMNDVTINVPAAPVSNSRIDVIEVNYQRLLTNPLSRGVLDVTLVPPDFDPTLLSKTLQFLLQQGDVTINGTGAINYKTGVAAVSPTYTAVDPGYVPLAWVKVASGDISIPNAKIYDQRTVLWPGGTPPSVGIYMTAFADGVTAPMIIDFVGPPGVPVYVVQAVGGVAGAVDIYIFGRVKAVATATSWNPAVLPELSSSFSVNGFDTAAQAEIAGARCSNPDADAPGSSYVKVSLGLKSQKVTANYTFDQLMGSDTIVNVSIQLGA